MADAAREADALFRPTLDHNLLRTTFEPGSISHNVEQRLRSTTEAHIRPAAFNLHLYTRHVAARALRVVLLSWRKLSGPGEEYEPGHVVDKFDYGYTAHASLQDKREATESLEYQVVHCLTEVFKDRGELTFQMLEGMIAGASKIYLQLMVLIDAAEASGKEVHADLGPEPAADTATYTAVLNETPSPHRVSKKRKIRAAGVETGVSEEEDVELEDAANKRQKTSVPTEGLPTFAAINTPEGKKKLAYMRGKQATLDDNVGTTSPAKPAPSTPQKKTKKSKPGSGNFNHTAHIKWTNGEQHFAEQRIRADPSTTWATLSKAITDKFSGTLFNGGKKGSIILEGRTVESVRQRFSGFRAKMMQRQQKNEATQGTESDVEASEDDVEYDVGSVEGGDEEVEEAESHGSAVAPEDAVEDPLADLEELSRRIDEDETVEED